CSHDRKTHHPAAGADHAGGRRSESFALGLLHHADDRADVDGHLRRHLSQSGTRQHGRRLDAAARKGNLIMRKLLRRAAIIAALLIPASIAFAAVTPNSAVDPQTPALGLVQFLQGTDSAGAYKTVYTCGSNGSKIVAMVASSSDGSAA